MARGGLTASFVRQRGARDRIHVTRSDGTETSWEFPTYGEGLPHDLVHLVVESGFGLRAGFWGRVDAGIDPEAINREANRRGGRDKYRGYGDDRRELLVAEGLAAVHWYDPEADDFAMCEAIAASCASFGVEAPPTITVTRVAEVRHVLAVLRRRWRQLDDRRALDLVFFADDPEAGLGALATVLPRG